MQRIMPLPSLLCAVVLCLMASWPSGSPVASAQEKAGKAEAVKQELAALQGTWKWLNFEQGGKDAPIVVETFYVFQNDRLIVKNKDKTVLQGTVSLDPTTSPRQLDVQFDSGQTDVTIYIRVGEYLIQCGHRDGKTRPTEFASGTPKGGAYLIVMKRQK